VGRAHNPHIDGNRFVTAQPLNSSFLQRAQKLRLHVGAHIANLIQEQRAAIGLFEFSLAARCRPRKSALFVAKKLRLNQFGR
jgi:hypothetical protein